MRLPRGRRVASAQNLGEIHTTAISNLPRGERPTADREGAGYAMGWFSMPDYRGMRALSHDGNTLGYTSEVFLLPEADLAWSQQVSGLQGIAAELVAVSRERAQPYLGAYEHGIRVDFTDQGFVLQTSYGTVPFSEYADSGFFVRTGELEARIIAGFDSDTAPTQVTLGMPGDDILSQPFVLQRIGD